jgi:type IV pilus assembly protein PilX
MKHRKHPRAQSGAALVIGLVLLVVLTLLAVSSMNSASLEFIMAGNEQYRANAFQAAEVGIEQTMFQGTWSTTDPNGKPYGPGLNGADSWATVVNQPVGTTAQKPPYNYDLDRFKTFHFEILSTGTSARGANAVNTQGVMILSPNSSDVGADPTGGGATKFN